MESRCIKCKMLQSLWSDDLLLEQLQSRGEVDVTGRPVLRIKMIDDLIIDQTEINRAENAE
ncbi:hypothetical protein sync_2179 [Synechococcus sp. CC9311]|nr:hypothetical protein sync_2179 [Synechococcus sp. CC9311]